MWAHRHLKNILQLKFRKNIDLELVLAETLKTAVSTEPWNSVAEFINKFPLQRLGGTCHTNMVFWKSGL
jgi:hypothetical protein